MKTIKNWKVISAALVLVAALASLAGMQVASADSRGANADVIFTKWVTAWNGVPPTATATVVADMAGVVSGDAGPGLFAGEVLEFEDTGDIQKITADYHINVGGTREFTAHLKVTQDSNKGTAVLKGKVTDGWMKGAEVRGSYQVADLADATDITNSIEDKAYQGTLHLQRDR